MNSASVAVAQPRPIDRSRIAVQCVSRAHQVEGQRQKGRQREGAAPSGKLTQGDERDQARGRSHRPEPGVLGAIPLGLRRELVRRRAHADSFRSVRRGIRWIVRPASSCGAGSSTTRSTRSTSRSRWVTSRTPAPEARQAAMRAHRSS